MKYFLEQLKDEEDLKDWLAEEKFKSVEYTVNRLTRKLKSHEGWLVGRSTLGSPASRDDTNPDRSAGGPRVRFGQRGGRLNSGISTEGPEVGADDDLVVQVATAVEVALKKPMEALVNLMKATDAARLNAQQPVGGAPQSSGDRGESWHVPRDRWRNPRFPTESW